MRTANYVRVRDCNKGGFYVLVQSMTSVVWFVAMGLRNRFEKYAL